MEKDYNKNAKKFFIYSYLNIDVDDEKEKEEGIIKCAQRAYRDLSRTLRFNKDSDQNDKDRKKFVTEICEEIKEEIENLLALNRAKKLNFNEKHRKICNGIIEKAENSVILQEIDSNGKKMYYGQAQKWLNMTLKYMWLTGIWDKEFYTEDLLSKLYIPIDSYIIEAVWENKKIELPIRNNCKRTGKYSAEKVKAWSKWDGSKNNSEYNSEYDKFQETLKQELNNEGTIPILWENNEWIEIAKKK